MHNIVVQSIDDEIYLRSAEEIVKSHSINLTEEKMFDSYKRNAWKLEIQ